MKTVSDAFILKYNYKPLNLYDVYQLRDLLYRNFAGCELASSDLTAVVVKS